MKKINSDTVNLPISIMPGIVWPAIPSQGGAVILAILQQLERSQWWTESQHTRVQLHQLSILIHYAHKNIPYHRDRIEAAGINKGERVTLDQWQKLPIMTRDEVQQAGPELDSLRVPPEHGQIRELASSGTTGAPIRIKATDMHMLMWKVFTMRDHFWHNRDLSKKLAVIRYSRDESNKPPKGAQSDNWGLATQGLFHTGTSVMLNINSNLSEQANWLIKHNPHYLLTYPTNIKALCQYFQEHDLKLNNLVEVRTLSEALDPDVRDICHETWNVPLIDVYTTQELGYLALQCPVTDNYHIQSENMLVEVINDEGMPCKPGEIGKVLVTPLHNFATPLFRYDIDDYAEVGAPCSCGRGLPTLKRIMGRVRNMIHLPNGEQRWPIFGYKNIWKIADIKQIQTIQHSINDIEVKLVSKEALNGEQEQKIKQIIQQSLDHEFNIQFTYLDEITRAANGKFEEFICLIK